MGSWWRSEEMVYASIIMSEQVAPEIVKELGIIGCMQFTDLNPELTPFQRRYVSFVKRCDEIERKIRYIHGEIKSMGVEVAPAGEVNDFIHNTSSPMDPLSNMHGSLLLETLEAKLDSHEQNLLELNKYSTKLTEEYYSKVFSDRKMISISK
jgi:V-type H+-transporting ATPase subunit a